MKAWITLSKSGHYSVTVKLSGGSRETIARKIASLADAREILKNYKKEAE